jgi:hypothetical protein
MTGGDRGDPGVTRRADGRPGARKAGDLLAGRGG